MPNGLLREKFGQGLPPVLVIFKKNGENRQRQNLKNPKMLEKCQIFQRLFVVETSQAPLRTLRQVPDNFAF